MQHFLVRIVSVPFSKLSGPSNSTLTLIKMNGCRVLSVQLAIVPEDFAKVTMGNM